MNPTDPSHAVILARIRLAVRRATGEAPDVEALFATPELAAASLARWRALGVAELAPLLDRYEQLSLRPGAVSPAQAHGPAATTLPSPAAALTVRTGARHSGYDSLYGLEGYGTPALPAPSEFLSSSSFDGPAQAPRHEAVPDLVAAPGAAQHRRYIRGAR